MAEFFAELISGKTSNERLIAFARGKEKKIWQDYRISASIRWTRFIFLAIGIVVFIGLLNQFSQRLANTNAFFTQFLILAACGLFFYLFNSAKTVEFDNDNMYVIDR